MQVIAPEVHDLGGFQVRRSLPAEARNTVGPFIFFDHLGPAGFPPGRGIDVRPHPHIGLATLTYLMEGDLVHRDSLGSVQTLRVGEVNWMTAGRGVVHSERSSESGRGSRQTIHALQLWIALPEEREETAPCFEHWDRSDLPEIEAPGCAARLLAGRAWGEESPVGVLSPLFLVDARMEPGRRWALPGGHEERAVYVIAGDVRVDGEPSPPHRLLVAAGDAEVEIESGAEGARVALLGGAPLEGPRIRWWNFVSSSPERIEAAKRDWREGRFPRVPGETEFIPLPEGRAPGPSQPPRRRV